MIDTRRIVMLGAAVVSATVVVACRKTPTPTPAPVQASTPGPDADSLRRAQADEAARRAAADAEARRRAAEDSAAAAARAAAGAAAAARSTLLAVVHFDYDQSDLRAEDRVLLDAKIPILQASPAVTIRVEGHTDERGSDEYNLALGQRRAAAVKAYLVQRGIADARITTVSYGEERPIAQGADEGAFSQNRRAEFAITAGEQTLRQP